MIWIGLYGALIIYALFYNKLNSKRKKVIFIIILSILCLIAGTRDVREIISKDWGGTDEYVYNNIYILTPKLDDVLRVYNSGSEYGISDYEIGYILFISFLKTLGFSYYGVVLIIAIIAYFCIYHGFKQYIGDYSIFLMVLMYKLFTYYTMVALRQCLAMSVFFLAIKYIENKQPIKYFSMCVIAIMFHNSAIYLPFVYILRYIPLDREKYLVINIVFAITLIFRIAHINVFRYVTDYLSKLDFIKQDKLEGVEEGTIGISWLHTIEYFIIAAGVYLFYDKIEKNEEHGEFAIRLSIALAPVLTLFSQYLMFTRIKDYFSLIYAVLLAYVSDAFDKKYKEVLRIVIIIWATYGFFRHLLNFCDGTYFTYYQSNLIEILSKDIKLFYK